MNRVLFIDPSGNLFQEHQRESSEDVGMFIDLRPAITELWADRFPDHVFVYDEMTIDGDAVYRAMLRSKFEEDRKRIMRDIPRQRRLIRTELQIERMCVTTRIVQDLEHDSENLAQVARCEATAMLARLPGSRSVRVPEAWQDELVDALTKMFDSWRAKARRAWQRRFLLAARTWVERIHEVRWVEHRAECFFPYLDHWLLREREHFIVFRERREY